MIPVVAAVLGLALLRHRPRDGNGGAILLLWW
jgi:hypothetical protein